MTAQPVTAAPTVEVPYGLGAAAGTNAVFNPPQDELDPSGNWRKRWGMGIEGESCGVGVIVDGELCAPTPLAEDNYAPLLTSQEALPFRVEAGVKCSTFGAPLGDELAAFRERAKRQVELIRWRAIAHELWTGTEVPTNRRLASPDAMVLADHPVTIVEAVSLLEDAFSVYTVGGPRLIHGPVRVAAYLSEKAVVTAQGSRFTTLLGNQVILDDGYPGTNPAGVAEPGVAWLYGTGPLTARLDSNIRPIEDSTADGVRYTDNTVLVRAEQYAAITWLCGHFAVPVQLCP